MVNNLKIYLRNLIFFVLYFSGIPFLIREFFQKNKITILTFHHIPKDSCEKIFKYLLAKYNVIPLKNYVDYIKDSDEKKHSIPPKALIITIDDGLKENYDLYDTIKKYDIPVTIFLTTGVIGSYKGFWWNHNKTSLSTEDLKKISDKKRIKTLESNGFFENDPVTSRESLSLNEIKIMSQTVDFQSHSVTHPILPKCDIEKVKYEITESMKFLKSTFKFDVYAFAYPNGNYSLREEEIIKSTGYDCALTTDHGFNTLNSDLFRLKRISGGIGHSIIETAVKSSSLWERISFFFR